MSSVQSLANQYILGLVRYMPGKPIEETAREIGMDADDIIKLASNENPLGPSPKAVEAMGKALAKAHIYPDGAAFELCSRLGAEHNVTWEQIVVGNGSSEIIELLCHCFLNSETEMIVSQYAFSMYKVMATLFGAIYTEIPAKNYGHDLDAMAAAVNERTRLIFVTNPNNPTGTIVSKAEVDAFMAKIPDHVIVVFDEAYVEYLDPALDIDALSYVHAGRNVCVLRTFSKLQGLAGLRIGYGIAKPDLVDLLHKARAPFNVNYLAQIAALAAVDDKAHLEHSRTVNRAGLTFFAREFDRMGLTYIPGYGNFILVRTGHAARVFAEMLNRGVIVRANPSAGLNDWIRITIGDETHNRRCLDVLTEVLPLIPS